MMHFQMTHRGEPMLLAELIQRRTGLSRPDAEMIVAMGGAYTGKYRCKDPNRLIRWGEPISAWYRLPISMEPLSFDPAWIIEDDGRRLVAAKPRGLPTQGRRDADYMAFYEVLKRALGGYLGLHQRLDQDTSGLMLFARDRSLNKDMTRAFQEHRLEKRYLAVAAGQWPFLADSAVIDRPLGPVRDARGTRQAVLRAGKPARSEVTRLWQGDGFLVLDVKPLTGRTHQIRVHLSSHGLPLLGDRLYGGPETPGFLLHAYRLCWPRIGALAAGDYHLDPPSYWFESLPPAFTAFYQSWQGSRGGALC